MLKGYFDRVSLPGVTFKMDDGILTPCLNHIRKVGAVLTYGAQRHRAWILGDPPRRVVKRVIRGQGGGRLAPVLFLAHYDMNRSTDETRHALSRQGRHHHGALLKPANAGRRAAVTSTSTSIPAAVKPDTMISVETGQRVRHVAVRAPPYRARNARRFVTKAEMRMMSPKSHCRLRRGSRRSPRNRVRPAR